MNKNDTLGEFDFYIKLKKEMNSGFCGFWYYMILEICVKRRITSIKLFYLAKFDVIHSSLDYY